MVGEIWPIPITQWQHIHGYHFRYIIVLTLPSWVHYGVKMSEGTVEWSYVDRGKVVCTLMYLHAGLMGLKTY